MKQKFLYLIPASALLLGSCSDISDNFRNEGDSNGDLVRIYASFANDDSDPTRTSLGSFNGEGFPYQWDEADAIGVFSVGENGVIPTTNAIFKYDTSLEDGRASFLGTPQILKYDNIWAYYPWSSSTEVESGRDISLTIRANQNYNFSAVPDQPTPGSPNGSFGQGEAPAVAWGRINVAEDNSYTFNLAFKPVAAYLAIPITGTAKISSVGISVQVGADNPEYVQLAGTLNIDMSNGEANLGNPGFNGINGGYATLDSPGTSENGGLITLDCGRGVQLYPENPTWFWFVVPANMPTTTDTQVTIYVNGNPEFLYTFNRSNNVTQIGRNQTIGLSKDNSREPFVYEENGGIPDNMELAFPDPIFREYVLENFDINGDGIITEEEALKVTHIFCSNMGIKSLQGIQYFTNLTLLWCHSNQLSILDLNYNPNLTELSCYDNQISSLDLSSNQNLTELNCYDNQLSSLDLSNTKDLTYLGCSGNQLSSLDLSSSQNLNILGCYDNQLCSLDLSNNPNLTDLSCNGNQLTSLDLSNNPNLNGLGCSYNQLISLDLSNNPNLTYLECSYNQLTSLDLSNNPNLNGLHCSNNQLISLVLSNNPNLTELSCNDNQLRSLDLSNSQNLNSLACYDNQLSSLDLSNNPNLTFLNSSYNQLSSLNLSNNPNLTRLLCYNNQLSSLDLSNKPNLTYLSCGYNQLTDLDLSNNKNLTELECYSNQLNNLDLSNNPNLTRLWCSSNQLTSLDLSHNPNLTQLLCDSNQLSSLDLSNNPNLTQLWCSSNQLTSLDLSGAPNLTELRCSYNQLITLDVSKTKLNEIKWQRPLDCYMESLKILYLKTGWEIEGININRSEYDIYPETQIEYKE